MAPVPIPIPIPRFLNSNSIRFGSVPMVWFRFQFGFYEFSPPYYLSRFKSFEIEPTTSDGHCFSKSFNGILDTSNYGILQLNNGLARTPQMGWNSWNFLACNINETIIKETAGALISTGLADLGYVYVNIGSVGP
ncbi:hypothetical protein LWI28_016847 [Acer negundo]|uniref:Alpha-galactosidase n=1 Tax=Acer negundo TaxID=4023 RepID=A0AAD5J550_ACENE|nr:hypothetical protein LWI28_016847 [Acer negundo]